MMGRAMKPFEKLLLPAVLYTGMAVAACGMDDGKGHLALKIHYNASTTVDGLRTNPPPEGEAPDDITDYRICVSAENMKNSKCENFNRADNPTGAKLGGLKPGDDRTVTFQGYDVGRDYEVRWCGNVSGVEVKTEKTTQVSMYISVCGDFTPVRNPMSIKRAFHTSTLLPDGKVVALPLISKRLYPDDSETDKYPARFLTYRNRDWPERQYAGFWDDVYSNHDRGHSYIKDVWSGADGNSTKIRQSMIHFTGGPIHEAGRLKELLKLVKDHEGDKFL